MNRAGGFSANSRGLIHNSESRIQRLNTYWSRLILAFQGLDLSFNNQVLLIPRHDNPVGSYISQTPTFIKDELLVELELMRELGKISTLFSSQDSSLSSHIKKPNGVLNLLMGLRWINYIIIHDCKEHNHQVTTIADEDQNLAGKTYFFELDCWKA